MYYYVKSQKWQIRRGLNSANFARTGLIRHSFWRTRRVLLAGKKSAKMIEINKSYDHDKFTIFAHFSFLNIMTKSLFFPEIIKIVHQSIVWINKSNSTTILCLETCFKNKCWKLNFLRSMINFEPTSRSKLQKF